MTDIDVDKALLARIDYHLRSTTLTSELLRAVGQFHAADVWELVPSLVAHIRKQTEELDRVVEELKRTRYPDEIPPHIKVRMLLDKGGYPGVQP